MIASGSGGGGGAGNVVGPESSTDEQLARADGTTGAIQFGVATESDAGTITTPIFVATNQIQVKSGASVKGQYGEGGPNLAGDGKYRWTNGGEPGGSGDTALSRAGGATVLVEDASGGLGFLLTGRSVEASTAGSGAPNLLAATESRKLITNEGASAEAYNTLPSAAAGMEFTFACQDADGIRIVANAGDTIRLSGTVSAAAGFVRSAVVGSTVKLMAINAAEWFATSIVGTWTVDL